jgi:hypothetical protein
MNVAEVLTQQTQPPFLSSSLEFLSKYHKSLEDGENWINATVIEW